MNTNEKNKIAELKQLGYGYKKIAKELNIALSTVRYVCNKTGDEDLLDGKCEHCGLKIQSIKGKKKKRFCSDKCRWQWWNKQHKEVNKKTFYIQQCKCCNKEFKAYGKNKRIYCSHECYIKFKISKGVDGHGSL